MNSPLIRPLQLAFFGFALLILIVLAATGVVMWREEALLEHTGEELKRLMAFEREHNAVQRRLLSRALRGKQIGEADLAAEVSSLIIGCTLDDEEIPARLDELLQLAERWDSLTPAEVQEAFALSREISHLENEYEEEVLGELESRIEAQLFYERSVPIALLAAGALMIPLTRRRVYQPLDRLGRHLSELGEGNFEPKPEDELAADALPIHRQLIRLGLRLQELEIEHRQREASLEDEVRSATSTLLAQQRSLARAERLAATGELAASVAHELRNPLAGIQMSLSNLRADLTDADLVERVEAVNREVDRLSRLVSGLVDSAKHTPEPVREVDVAELLAELQSLLRYQLPPGTLLVCDVPASLRCRLQREALRQALLNLVMNSSRAVPEDGGRIEVGVRGDGRDLRVDVRDNGPGFPEDLLRDGIRPFYSPTPEGTGLGLAIVRRVMRDVGGTLELANGSGSGPGGGACAALCIPDVVMDG